MLTRRSRRQIWSVRRLWRRPGWRSRRPENFANSSVRTSKMAGLISIPRMVPDAVASAAPAQRRPARDLAAVEIVRQPQRHAGPEIHDDHAEDHDQHIG